MQLARGDDAHDDGPSTSGGEPRRYGSRCPTGCAVAAITIGAISVPYTALTLAVGPRTFARHPDKVWSWIGVGVGATLVTIGTTHAVLNRHELASDAIVPLAVAGPTGAAALALGVYGLVGDPGSDGPGAGAIACRGTRCKVGLPAPVITGESASFTLASGSL